jgi:8-amino-7-oxononanoate synthase
LRELLHTARQQKYSRILIVTESVFSMDGDCCPLDEMADLALNFGAILVVDEAHATGVSGPQGMGLTCGKPVDVVIGTFSKALGSFGAYVACSRKIRDYLLNCCAGIIYSTALPPPVLGAISAALDLVPGMERERCTLHARAAALRATLGRMGYNCGRSTTQIVPVTIGLESETTALSEHLADRGIFAQAIRPPTVEAKTSRIRLAVTASHGSEDIGVVVDALGEWKNRGF